MSAKQKARTEVATTPADKTAPAKNVRSSLRRETIEAQVFDVAARLFAEQGYGSTSLQDIASALGVSRTALYYYVSSKEDLLQRIVHDLTDAGHAVVTEALEADGSARDKIHQTIVGMIRIVASQASRFRLLLQSESWMPADIARAHRATRRKVLDGLIQLIEEGQQAGELRPVDARTAGMALVGMWNWTAFWVRDETSIDEIAEAYADLAVTGLERRTPTGGPQTSLELVRALREELATLEIMLERQ